MKRILIFLIVCVIFSLPARSQETINTKDMLIGEWVFEFDKSFSLLEQSSIKYLDTIPAEQYEAIKNNYLNRRIIFLTDGTYQQVQGDGQEVNATWRYEPADQMLEIKLPNGAVFYQRVLSVSENTLLISPSSKGEVNIIVNMWYFTKS